jgi:hypothetical protein
MLETSSQRKRSARASARACALGKSRSLQLRSLMRPALPAHSARRPLARAAFLERAATARCSAEGGAAPAEADAHPTSSASAAAATTRLSFTIPYRTAWGDHVALVGSHPALGGWDPARARPLEWSEGDAWCLSLEVCGDGGGEGGSDGPSSSHAAAAATTTGAWEYKYIVRGGDGGDGGDVRAWSPGENFALPLPAVAGADGGHSRGVAAVVTVADAWDGARHDVCVETVAAAPEEAEEEADAGVVGAAEVAASADDDDDHDRPSPSSATAAATAAAAAELAAALAESADAVATFGPASRAALAADARVAAAEAAVRASVRAE